MYPPWRTIARSHPFPQPLHLLLNTAHITEPGLSQLLEWKHTWASCCPLCNGQHWTMTGFFLFPFFLHAVNEVRTQCAPRSRCVCFFYDLSVTLLCHSVSSNSLPLSNTRQDNGSNCSLRACLKRANSGSWLKSVRPARAESGLRHTQWAEVKCKGQRTWPLNKVELTVLSSPAKRTHMHCLTLLRGGGKKTSVSLP